MTLAVLSRQQPEGGSAYPPPPRPPSLCRFRSRAFNIGNEIVQIFRLADAGQRHLVARDFLFGRAQECPQFFRRPDEAFLARFFHRSRVSIVRHAARRAADNPVKLRADPVFSALTDGVTGGTPLEDGLALGPHSSERPPT